LYVQKPFYPEGPELAHVYLLRQGVQTNPRDRWNNTPTDAANWHKQVDALSLLDFEPS